MKPEEYDNLNQVELEHWYYSGKRAIAEIWLRRLGLRNDKSQRLADCGAGTGAFAISMSEYCNVLAIDDYQESLDILGKRLPSSSILRGSCTALPLEDESCDFITALDVLEHIEDDKAAIREMWRAVKPGGGIVITVPALMSLWSDWDVSLLHFRRYDYRSLLKLVTEVSPEILNCNYMNFFAFPIVWLLRQLRGCEARGSSARAEDKIPLALANKLLRRIFVWSSSQREIQWPFGVGLLCVLRKPN